MLKKLVVTLGVSLSLLLVGCSDNPTKNEETSQPVEKESKGEVAITVEDAKETVQKIQDQAKENKVVQDIQLNEEADVVYVTIEFNPSMDERAKHEFLFNYLLFLEQSYPDQKIEFKELINFEQEK